MNNNDSTALNKAVLSCFPKGYCSTSFLSQPLCSKNNSFSKKCLLYYQIITVCFDIPDPPLVYEWHFKH